MPRPPLEVAELVRSAGRNFIERNRSWLNRLHLKVLTAIERCRTAALGGHLDECAHCGHRVFAQLLRQTFRKKWVVYGKRPFGGAKHALRYLGSYTHRVASRARKLPSVLRRTCRERLRPTRAGVSRFDEAT